MSRWDAFQPVAYEDLPGGSGGAETLPPPAVGSGARPCQVTECDNPGFIYIAEPRVHVPTRQVLAREALVCATCYPHTARAT